MQLRYFSHCQIRIIVVTEEQNDKGFVIFYDNDWWGTFIEIIIGGKIKNMIINSCLKIIWLFEKWIKWFI